MATELIKDLVTKPPLKSHLHYHSCHYHHLRSYSLLLSESCFHKFDSCKLECILGYFSCMCNSQLCNFNIQVSTLNEIEQIFLSAVFLLKNVLTRLARTARNLLRYEVISILLLEAMIALAN